MRRTFVVFAALLAVSSPAAAQTYVGASLVGDIARFSHVEIEGIDDRSGEAIGFGLRVGTSITDVVGVDVEFIRPSRLESTLEARVLPAIPEALLTPVSQLLPDLVFPPLSYDVRTETRNTTVAASVWAKQQLTGRLALVYSGGVAVVRSHQDSWLEYSAPFVPGPILPRVPTSFSIVSQTVSYSLQPQVGVEARVAMTERLQLIPGLRLYGLDGGVLLRPAVGLGWTF